MNHIYGQSIDLRSQTVIVAYNKKGTDKIPIIR